ncbi:MAG: antitoxin of toxin-antitoxin stability system [Hydrogenophilales bacterium 17-64-11]|nr:MAG: antitoxin of toxin-antitoxin stability system [Hydrogenophilales bacterium 17-64-11]
MPKVICTTAYQFPELSDAAKEKARSWYREAAVTDDWWDAVYDDFERVCDILGVSLKTRPVLLLGGGSCRRPCIWFSGFSSQGDGASFEATVRHAKASAREIRSYAPKDVALHGIADRLQGAQRQNFYQLGADVSHRGRYYHEYCMAIDVARDSPTGQAPTEGSEQTVVEALRDLARWLYRQLEAEYDHLTSDEAVDEGIIMNEYTFTDAGRRFG